jgi:heme/copper-type cytochrome/quinol oxidase subunit 2
MKTHRKPQQLRFFRYLSLLVLVLLVLPFWNTPLFAQTSVKHVWIVTNEIKVAAKQGKPEMEVYRWDPGTIVLHQGDHVMFHIYGVKGASHPFALEGYPVKGIVLQGQVTKIAFTADKAGTFPLVCLSHTDLAHHGPMIAYVEVLPKQ